MTLNEFNGIIQTNDANLSFIGEKFFVAKKYNLKTKDVSDLELQVFYEDILRKTLSYNYSIANACFLLVYDTNILLNGNTYAVTRTEKFIERQGGWLKYKVTDVSIDGGATLQTFYTYKEADLIDICN